MFKLLVLIQCVVLSGVLRTSASGIPIHGYQVVEGGYYPGEIGYGGGGYGLSNGIGYGGYGREVVGPKVGPIAGYGGGIGLGGPGIGLGAAKVVGGYGSGLGYGPAGGIGYSQGYGGVGLGAPLVTGAAIGPKLALGNGVGYAGGIGYGAGLGRAGIGGYGAGLGGAGLVGAGLGGAGLIGAGIGGYGDGYINKNIYSAGKKDFNDGKYEKALGKKGGETNHGQSGYSEGKVALKDVKGDTGYYSNVGGGKNIHEDGKQYHGAQHFGEEGKKGLEHKEKNGYKKGHVIKGYKSSHHKDETGNTEEYFDEDNDEGGHFRFNDGYGSFGKNGASSFKGGLADDKFNEGVYNKQVHYDDEHFVDKISGDVGKYGGNKYAGNGAVYGVNSGIDEYNLAGHDESSRFYKHHPHHEPFYHYK